MGGAGRGLIRLESAVVRRRDRLLLGPVSLAVEPGELVGVLGPNGAGKSTLVRLAAGVEPPSSGAAEVLGHPVTSAGARRPARLRREIGLLPQEDRSRHDLPFTVEEVVELGRVPWHGRPGPLPAAERERVGAAMEALGVAGWRRRRYAELSGGERQKVQLARLVAQQARVLLLDEPTAGLDVDWQLRFGDLVEEVRAATGATVVMVSHEVERLPTSTGRMVLLAGGKVVADGPPAAVLEPILLEAAYGCPMAVARRDGRWVAWSRRAPLGVG